MQLERARLNSEEAGVAGWISSNDVALFTVVLILVIAIFLQANLHKRIGENGRLESQNETLTKENKSTFAQIAILQRYRKTLDEQLLASSASLDRAQESIATEIAERAKLNTLRDDLQKQLAAATEKLADLQTALSELQKETDEKLKAKESELADAMEKAESDAKAMTELARQRDLLNALATELRERVRVVESKLDQSDTNIVAVEKEKTQLSETVKLLRQMVAASEKNLTTANERIEVAGESEKLLNLQVAALQAQMKNLLAREKEMQEQLVERQAERKKVSKKLIGLRGAMRRVAILVDSSGSLAEEEGRWENVREIVMTWLEHLEVDECVLVVFSSSVTTYPEDGGLFTVRGQLGQKNRTLLKQVLAERKPGGWTNTVGAFETAYNYDSIDTVVLFTDGSPTKPKSGAFNPEAAERIYALCSRHKDIPINTVGVGDYFKDQELSTFLRRLADLSGGTFLGR